MTGTPPKENEVRRLLSRACADVAERRTFLICKTLCTRISIESSKNGAATPTN